MKITEMSRHLKRSCLINADEIKIIINNKSKRMLTTGINRTLNSRLRKKIKGHSPQLIHTDFIQMWDPLCFILTGEELRIFPLIIISILSDAFYWKN